MGHFFSIYSVIVYYGGDLILPVIMLFAMFVLWAVVLWIKISRLSSKVEKDFRRGLAALEDNRLDRISRQIDVLLWFSCVFPVLGISGTLLGVSRISHATEEKIGEEMLRLGVLESISTTLTGFFIFILTYLLYRYLSNKYNNLLVKFQELLQLSW